MELYIYYINEMLNDIIYNLDYILVDYRKIYDRTSLGVRQYIFRYKSLTQKNLGVERTLNYKYVRNNMCLSLWQCHILFDMKRFEFVIIHGIGII